jgi:hypothetical protein
MTPLRLALPRGIRYHCPRMEPGQASKRIIQQVEERTGLPVRVEPDSNLPGTTLATVRMARGRTRMHQVFYQPKASTYASTYATADRVPVGAG